MKNKIITKNKIFKMFAIIFSLFIVLCSASILRTIIEPVSASHNKNIISNEIIYLNPDTMTEITDINFHANEEKISQLFEELGIENITYTKLYKKLSRNIDYVKDIISTSYYKVDNETGEIQQIEKNAICSEKTSNDGYLSATVLIIPNTNEEVGTYDIISFYKWLKVPLTRQVDAVSLQTENITLLSPQDKNNDCFATFICTQETNINGHITNKILCSEKNIPDYIYTNGVYFTFDLPNNTIRTDGINTTITEYENMMLIIYCKGRVDNFSKKTESLAVDSKYIHVKLKGLSKLNYGYDTENADEFTIINGTLAKETYSPNRLSWFYEEHFDLWTN